MTDEQPKAFPIGRTETSPSPSTSLGTFEAWTMRLGTLGELVRMLRRHRRAWLVPMMVVLGLLGLALSGLQAFQYVAPFLYAVF
jgi:hypothetical protein